MNAEQIGEAPEPHDDDSEADDALDEMLDILDALEAERLLADPNLEIVPFNPKDYE